MYVKNSDLNLDENYEYVNFLNTEYKCRITHMFYCTAVELLVNPESSQPLIVSEKLVNAISFYQNYDHKFNFTQRCNVVAILLAILPKSYRDIFENQVVEEIKTGSFNNLETFEILNCNEFDSDQWNAIFYNKDASMLDRQKRVMSQIKTATVICLGQALYYQIGMLELSLLPDFLREKIKPIVTDEKQFLFICRLIGPSINRIHEMRTKIVEKIISELYFILENSVKKYTLSAYVQHPDGTVSPNPNRLKMSSAHVNQISDILYFFKYKFLGNAIDNVIEKVIKNFPEELLEKFKFILARNSEVKREVLIDPFDVEIKMEKFEYV